MEARCVSTSDALLERFGSHRHRHFVFPSVSPWDWRHGFWGAWLNSVLSNRTPNAKKDSVPPKELRSKAATIQQLGQLRAFLYAQVRGGRKLSETLQTELASSMLVQRHRAMSCVLLRLGASTAVSSIWHFKCLASLSRTSLLAIFSCLDLFSKFPALWQKAFSNGCSSSQFTNSFSS